MRYNEIVNLTEISLPKTRNDVHDKLLAAGYVCIGKGNWGKVYKKFNSQYVLKIFSANDNAYLSFLRMTRNHSNIHFPKIIGNIVELTSEYFGVRLEPLTPMQKIKKNYELISNCRNYINGKDLNEFEFGMRMIDADNPYLTAREFMKENPSIKNACDLIETLLPNYSLDIDRENVMMRDDILVFVDPVYDRQS